MKIILAIFNTVLSLLIAFFLLSGFGMSGYFENFTLKDDLFGVVLMLAMIVIATLSSIASWMYAFRPPEMIRDMWKFFAFGSLIIAAILLQINL